MGVSHIQDLVASERTTQKTRRPTVHHTPAPPPRPEAAVKYAKALGFCKAGDTIVVLSAEDATPTHESSLTTRVTIVK